MGTVMYGTLKYEAFGDISIESDIHRRRLEETSLLLRPKKPEFWDKRDGLTYVRPKFKMNGNLFTLFFRDEEVDDFIKIYMTYRRQIYALYNYANYYSNKITSDYMVLHPLGRKDYFIKQKTFSTLQPIPIEKDAKKWLRELQKKSHFNSVTGEEYIE